MISGLKAKAINFEWRHDSDSPNPTCHRVIGDGYSAYVLIPYDQGNDPAMGRGTWNGVAQNKGQMGFASKEDAIAYCEKTINDFAQVAVNCASNFLDVETFNTHKLEGQADG